MTLAVVMAMLFTSLALADLVDGDTVISGTSSANLGTVAPGTILTQDVTFQLLCNSNKHVDVGQTVNLTFSLAGSTVPAGSLSASNASIGAIPGAWPDDATGPDNCGGTAPLNDNGNSTVTITAPSAPGPYTYVVKYNVSISPSQSDDPNDITGAAPTATFTLTVSAPADTTAPTLHLPGNMTVEATGASGSIVTYSATADDANPAHPTVTCNPASGSTFALGTTTVNCSATDTASNTANGSFTVTVQDTTDPSIADNSNILLEATGPSGAVATFSNPAASDSVDGSVDVQCVPPSGSTFGLGTASVTCTATDDSGNSNSSSFDVTVQDTTAPSLNLPAVINAEATGASGAMVSYTATATDLVDGSVAANCSPVSGSTFALGTTLVSCSAIDSHSNNSSGSFNVVVSDTTAPVLALPDDITAEATGPSGAAVSYTASASDLVDGAVTPSCSPLSGATFPLGTTAVACSATDAHSNTSNGSFNVTVKDTTAPTIEVHGNETAEATGPSGAVVNYTSPATHDAVSGDGVASCLPASGTTFALGTTTVTCSASDAAGNSSSSSFDVTVEDTTAPTIDPHGNETAEATGPSGAVVNYTSPATHDAVDGDGVASCTPASGSTFALGTTTVTCTATDAADNSSSSSFTVTVEDTTAPTIDLHGNETAEATGPSGAVVNYTSPATHDAVDGDGVASCAPASGSTFALGTTTVTCTATDAAGNSSNSSFTVTVQDTTSPTIADNLDMVVPATSSGGAVVNFSNPAATDSVDLSVDVVCVPASGSIFLPGHTTVTCTATDDSGNTAQSSFDVWVKYQFRGFYQPVDMGILNIVKGGSTVPLKFEVFAGSTELTNTNIISAFTQRINCAAGTGDDIEQYATGGTSLRYDVTGGQFIFNWQTPRQPGACYRVTLTTTDGNSIYADFKLK